MGTAGTALEAIQAGKKVFKQGKEIHGNIMEVHDKIHEFIPLSKDIPKNRAELFQASKTAFKQRHEIHGKVRELHGQILDIHGQVLDVHGQVMGVQGKLHEAAQQQAPQDTAGFKKGAKGYARGCFCGCWVMLKAEAKKYITYVFSLIIFAIITIGLICFLIPVLWHHAHLQLLTLTTTARMPETTRGGNLNSRNESVDYRVFLLHYCVSGLTAQAEKQFNVKNGCHYSTQALYDHILPALGTTFTPALAGKDVPDPSTDIQAMFKHYGYTSCCLYIIDVILAPVVAGVFIWWFISTLKPLKRTFRAFLCASLLLGTPPPSPLPIPLKTNNQSSHHSSSQLPFSSPHSFKHYSSTAPCTSSNTTSTSQPPASTSH
ncbi:hypothetical protein DSL72_004066 [Monilinia vaccinii-corymbosi]|uniref:Uncharacterized protein n=1 Tax=Monilinia vaccinii-corymbosi TaxID=61207 RepID=A0A8A3P3T7_9HELO|nr:hypothetical protein DSL72_004066 [Monilinia vaccinii-corymbosi]